jgi:hypothetical protein
MYVIGDKVEVSNEYGMQVSGVVTHVDKNLPSKVIYTVLTKNKINIKSESQSMSMIESKAEQNAKKDAEKIKFIAESASVAEANKVSVEEKKRGRPAKITNINE